MHFMWAFFSANFLLLFAIIFSPKADNGLVVAQDCNSWKNFASHRNRFFPSPIQPTRGSNWSYDRCSAMLDSLFCVNLRAAAQLEAGAPSSPLPPPKCPLWRLRQLSGSLHQNRIMSINLRGGSLNFPSLFLFIVFFIFIFLSVAGYDRFLLLGADGHTGWLFASFFWARIPLHGIHHKLLSTLIKKGEILWSVPLFCGPCFLCQPSLGHSTYI